MLPWQAQDLHPTNHTNTMSTDPILRGQFRSHLLAACLLLLTVINANPAQAAASPNEPSAKALPAASQPTAAASTPEELAAAKAEAKRTEKELRITTAQDDELAARVRARLLRIPEFANVRAEVAGGVVLLTGEVRDEEDRRRLPALVKSVSGVVDVDSSVRLNTDLDDRLASAWGLIKDRATRLVAMLPVFVVALVVIWLFNRVGRWFARRPKLLGWQTPNPYLNGLLQRTIGAGFTLGGLLIALDLLGATALVGAVIGSAGVVGIVVGFAFRDVAENYLAGVLLSLRRPFEPGDHIIVGGKHEGRVMALNARATTLMTLDGTHLRLPNAMVFKEVLLNLTRNPRRRFRFALGVNAEEDLAEAQRLGVELRSGMTGVLQDPPPRAQISDVGDSSVQVEFFAWVDQREADFVRVRSEAIRLVMHALRQAGMDLPEPTYRVQWVSPGGAAPVMGAPGSDAVGHAEDVAPERIAPQDDVSVNRDLDRQLAEARAKSPTQHDLLRQPNGVME